MTVAEFAGKLRGVIDRRVYFPTHATLRFRQGLGGGRHGRFSDHHQVYIACRPLPAAGEGAKHECQLDLRGQRGYCCLQQVRQAHGFDDQVAQLLMYGRRRVGSVENLIADFPAFEYPDSGEQFQFPLDRTQGRAGKPGDLADMELLVRSAHEEPKHGPAGPPKEDGCQIIDGRCIHIRYDCTRFSNNCRDQER